MNHRPRQISMSLWLHQGLTENMCLGDWGVLPERKGWGLGCRQVGEGFQNSLIHQGPKQRLSVEKRIRPQVSRQEAEVLVHGEYCQILSRWNLRTEGPPREPRYWRYAQEYVQTGRNAQQNEG